VVLACLSSYKNKPLRSTVAISEIGLLSELKQVVGEKTRIREAKKMGFKNIITSAQFSYLNDIMKNL
jgi:predicted ATP-dependent serine protease